MNLNKRHENLELMLLKIFVGIRIPTFQNTRIRLDPDPKHVALFYHLQQHDPGEILAESKAQL